ncbi:MAG TPA: FG-GAP-like repeat-containing protein [Methylomirabilota bacterium]|nr:FG-GAP-like repeat-containing protein [Methylomirabilota bacterium]
MRRLVAAGSLVLALASEPSAWPLVFGTSSGNRVAAGSGTFPRWQALALQTDAPVRWLVAFAPGRLAGLDKEGTFSIFQVSRGGVSVAGRYGEVASPDAPPVTVRLEREQTGVVLVATDGRLLLWSEDALRGYDVGAPLSRLTFPVPVKWSGRDSDDLLAVAQDGGVVLIGGLNTGGPRIIARTDARALPDARITIADLDGDGVPEALVLADPTDRYPHGILGDRIEAGSLVAIGLSPNGLDLRARYTMPAPAVFEDLVPLVASVGGTNSPVVLLARSAPRHGAALVALGWREGGLALVAEGVGYGQSHRWTHLIGAADLTGDGKSEVVAVATPHLVGVLSAYRLTGGYLARIARAPGYSSHAAGSRNLEQALIADLDGNGFPEVVVPRQSRDALAGLELQGDRWAERWSLDLKATVRSNLLAADLDGDGLLDLAVADRRALNVFLSVR